MDVAQLYGDHRSGNCYKAALLLHLTGKAFEWVETNVFEKATRTPEFLALNPNGKVPLLVLSDGRALAESNAMLLFLGEGTSYVPADIWSRALVWQWLFFEQYSHEPYIAVARTIALSGQAAKEVGRLAGLIDRGHQALTVMEGALTRTEWIAGGDFTIADIALYAYTHTAEEGGIELSPYPRVRAWLDRVAGQPGFLPMDEACRSALCRV